MYVTSLLLPWRISAIVGLDVSGPHGWRFFIPLASSRYSFSASYYHRVSGEIEAGGKAVWDTKSAGMNLEVGTKAYMDPSSFVKAKINNAGLLVLGYTQGLRPGVKASFGLALDTQRLNNPVRPSFPDPKSLLSLPPLPA
jgi:hypothetical protein